MIDFKHFCKCHNLPQYNNNIIKRKEEIEYLIKMKKAYISLI
jgi:hypothetical protein